MNGYGKIEAYFCMKGTMLPIPNGILEIYDDDSDSPLFTAMGDESGVAWIPALPCPKRTDAPSYHKYTIIAHAKGFLPLKSAISIFDGVTSYQSFPLSLKNEE